MNQESSTRYPERAFKGITQALETLQKPPEYILSPEEKQQLIEFSDNQIKVIEVNVRIGGYRRALLLEAAKIDLDELGVGLALGEHLSDHVTYSQSVAAIEFWSQQQRQVTEIKDQWFQVPGIKLMQRYHWRRPYAPPPQGDVPLFTCLLVDKRATLTKSIDFYRQILTDLGE